jgi:hypothetical protein
MIDRPLTPRQDRYVTGVLSGLSETAAARQAGYGLAYSKKAASRVGTIPAVQRAIETAQAALREKAMYDVEQAVQEIDQAITFGYAKSNPMSVAKLLELKAKLYGLLIDRFQEVPVDLRGALLAAERRVIDVTNVTPLPLDGALAGSIGWAPRIPGDAEAGSADGESVR